jgi:endonuclease YncB( thermonuclease family)
MGHFGKTPQPFSQEAKDWLAQYIEGQHVSVKLLKMDQYERIVGTGKLYVLKQ